MVFFDGGCPLCSREINHYRTLHAIKMIEWIDITLEPERLQAYGFTVADAMAEFHVLDTRDSHVYKGIDGFLLLWNALPYYRYLSFFCKHLHIVPLMKWAYIRFAQWHFQKRCSEGHCRVNTPLPPQDPIDPGHVP